MITGKINSLCLTPDISVVSCAILLNIENDVVAVFAAE